jgi:survival-of-motor-neuron-related-splicing factor 30
MLLSRAVCLHYTDDAQRDQVSKLMEANPGDKQYDALLPEFEMYINMHEAALARLRPELADLQAQLPQASKTAAPKFDPEKHPLLRKAAEKQEPEQPVTFSTGDMVEAQWTDRSWYKAKIQSVLGSASAPKYLVRFIEYEDSITVDRNAVRALPSKRKREPEPAAAPSPAVPVTSTPHVISGPASINPNAQLAKKNIADDEEVKPKSRIANKGQLKKRMSNWQDFQAKTGKKIPKKDSMFRTSTEAGSRGRPICKLSLNLADIGAVGFTGSGKGMTETLKRTRYDHKADAENDEEYSEAAPQSRKRFG